MGKSGALGIGATVLGAPEVVEAVRGVKFGVGNRVLVQELRKVASKGVRFAKSLLGSKRTGILGKSLGYVYRKPKRSDSGGGAYAIGPRRSFSVTIQPPPGRLKKRLLRVIGKKPAKTPKLSKKVIAVFKGKRISPARYAHLVEGGRRAVGPKKARMMSDGQTIFGSKAQAVQAKPFMRPANAMIQQTGPGEIAAGVRAGITREAAKYAAKGKSIYGVPGT